MGLLECFIDSFLTIKLPPNYIVWGYHTQPDVYMIIKTTVNYPM